MRTILVGLAIVGIFIVGGISSASAQGTTTRYDWTCYTDCDMAYQGASFAQTGSSSSFPSIEWIAYSSNHQVHVHLEGLYTYDNSADTNPCAGGWAWAFQTDLTIQGTANGSMNTIDEFDVAHGSKTCGAANLSSTTVQLDYYIQTDPGTFHLNIVGVSPLHSQTGHMANWSGYVDVPNGPIAETETPTATPTLDTTLTATPNPGTPTPMLYQYATLESGQAVAIVYTMSVGEGVNAVLLSGLLTISFFGLFINLLRRGK